MPRDLGTPNARIRATAVTRMRCHQTKVSGTPQNGQAVYGGLLPIGLALRSRAQFGQVDRACLCFSAVVSSSTALYSMASQPLNTVLTLSGIVRTKLVIVGAFQVSQFLAAVKVCGQYVVVASVASVIAPGRVAHPFRCDIVLGNIFDGNI